MGNSGSLPIKILQEEKKSTSVTELIEIPKSERKLDTRKRIFLGNEKRLHAIFH